MKKFIKHIKTKIKYYVLTLFVGLNFFIGGQALLSSEDSADVSNTFASFFSALFQAIGPVEADIVEPESITISGPDLVIIGQSRRLTPTILPSEATDKSVYWTTDNDEVLEVTTGGIVVAKAIGAATIRATTAIASVYVETYIQVMDFPAVSSFEIETETTEIFVGTTTKLNLVDVLPELARMDTVSWESLNDTIASVNEYGVVKGLDVGTASIKASAGTFERMIDISVSNSPTPVIAPTTLEISGDTDGFIYRYTQLTADFGAVVPTDTGVTWLSSDINIARVDDTGKVYGYKFEGEVTITAISHADDTLRDTLVMNFVKVYPTSVTLQAAKTEIVAGHSLNINFDFDPIDTYDRQLVWSSSDEDVATISSRGEFGLLTAKKMGEVTISAHSTMDENVSASIQITVLKASTLNQEQEQTLYQFIRKGVGHFSLFFVDGILGYLTLYYFLKGQRRHGKYLLITLGMGLILAVALESLQFLAPGRSPLLSDAIINFLGYLFASLMLFTIFIVRIWRKNRAVIKPD